MNDPPDAQLDTYDFRNPSQLTGNVQRALEHWTHELGASVSKRWTELIGVELTWQTERVDTRRPSEAFTSIPETIIAYRVSLGDIPDSLLLLTRPFVLALVAGMLGERDIELAEDRELTVVEKSLGGLAVQEVVVALEESWPGTQPLPCRVAGVEEELKRARQFPDSGSVICNTFTLDGPFETQRAWWLLTHDNLESLFQSSVPTPPNIEQRNNLERLVMDIPVRVVVGLGQASIHISQLANLRPGDVIILEQRVSDPLVIHVETQQKMTGWPGRVGARQAVCISSSDD